MNLEQNITATIEMVVTRADGTVEVLPVVPMLVVDEKEDSWPRS